MSFITLVFLALAMSTDAFAAAVGKGATLKAPRFINALKMGVIFGVIEGITPIIGWLIGSAGASYIEAWDHWLAFALLVALGGHLIYESLGSDEQEQGLQQANKGLLKIIITAVGTSIDALTVGIGLAFLDVNILLAALMIGVATFTMVTIGSLLGQRIGQLIGKKAEALGGLVLIVIGCWILYSHLTA